MVAAGLAAPRSDVVIRDADEFATARHERMLTDVPWRFSLGSRRRRILHWSHVRLVGKRVSRETTWAGSPGMQYLRVSRRKNGILLASIAVDCKIQGSEPVRCPLRAEPSDRRGN